MRLFNKNDDEILKTIQMAVRMSSRSRIEQYFREKTEKNPQDPDTWFHYGICSWEMMNTTNKSQEKHKYLVNALQSCAEACAIQSDHWPSLFLRAMIRSMMSGEDVDEMALYLLPTDYTEEDADRDWLLMINLQSKEEPQAYNFIPYTGIAYRLFEKKNPAEGGEYIQRGLMESPASQVIYFQDLLCIPVLILHKKLLKLGKHNLARQVAERYNLLFPQKKI